ncbi:MAG: transcription-repair coupling factor [Alphaproteobacteria bacterium TMED87]|nr:transcription-repair coupling factor [Rhodospirillaceae bacterium]OUV11830.1 MAG: transcription-repair coupling factor [Alphaproteobacteria bacterium TMED87]
MDDKPFKLGCTSLSGALEGADAYILSKIIRSSQGGHIHIVTDDVRLSVLSESLNFFSPDITIIKFPAWDSVPYDRVSPRSDLVGQRMDAFVRLAAVGDHKEALPWVVITTVASAIQKTPPLKMFRGMLKTLSVGEELEMKNFSSELINLGFVRNEQVMSTGEFAIRGSLFDIFLPGYNQPVRIDFFGNQIDSIKYFDPVSQRTRNKAKTINIKPVSEVILSKNAIENFRIEYRKLFGSVSQSDELYDFISNGRSYPGMEHWLPLFYSNLDTIFSYTPNASLSLDWNLEESIDSRLNLISEYFESRRILDPISGGKKNKEFMGDIYHPIPPSMFFLDKSDFLKLISEKQSFQFNPYISHDEIDNKQIFRPGLMFSSSNIDDKDDKYHSLFQYIKKLSKENIKVLISLNTQSSLNTFIDLARKYDLTINKNTKNYFDVEKSTNNKIFLITLPVKRGFENDKICVITEEDIFGERQGRRAYKKRKGDAFISDVSQLHDGDLVVHIEHGIGRYNGLEAINVGDALHDCLKVLYNGADRLFVPVENIDVLSRFGSDSQGVALDHLGGAAWQARKSKLKERIKDMAEQLIRISAERQIKEAEKLIPNYPLYNDFCSKFTFNETEDQLQAIDEVIDDIGSGRPMDRLICGDVGFGKTEVALRAAFVAALSGVQVAIVVPTTLLARQHYLVFSQRCKGFPVNVAELSRLVSQKKINEVKNNLKDGKVNIIIGTHALISKSIEFANLGLLIIDEEQHFGVSHKERLKELKSDVHVLTMTATPIPRTLQMALSGVRELSLIATPPVDRLAVRTFVLPFDRVVIREAIMREKYRGGQSFYVCPRISDLEAVAKQIEEIMPEVSLVVAHGQMSSNDLENAMTDFSSGKYDILLATNIIESGLDLPKVNTIIIHRADNFGLSQLYQLRGRVGRSNVRAYAYLTINQNKKLTPGAQKRLNVMQTLDNIGAGFSLASHDLDIRGAGNLLGEEQSGHIKEVGVELYQKMLREGVEAARTDKSSKKKEEDEFSPQINLGTSVLIPETYVKDLGTRLTLYRRAAELSRDDEIDDFSEEMLDRFGKLPTEVKNLLDIVKIKSLCRLTNIEKIEAGPKGTVLSLYKNAFPNPEGLISFISTSSDSIKVRSDHKIVVSRQWADLNDRVDGVFVILNQLLEIIE